jgi:hypothetical protein
MYLEDLSNKNGSDPVPGYYSFALWCDDAKAPLISPLRAYAVSKYTGDSGTSYSPSTVA